MATEPAAVWRLIQKADEVVKYAGNRDRATAFAQARATLDEAEALASTLEDVRSAAGFRQQIETRRGDIARLSAED